jgi:DNA repair exonuclease SbcCD ATPase subunit
MSWRNFTSFGEIETFIDLTQIGTIFLYGVNLDTGSANGTGKSSIINAFCYAVYNKPRDSISLQRLINSTNACKNTLMEARIAFSKGEDEYEVYRCRGAAYNILITKNGVDITPDSVSESDKLVEEIIGISYELFTKVIVFSGSAMPFLEMPVAFQRNYIEELFKITLLSEKAIILKKKIQQTENDIQIAQVIILEQETAVKLHAKRIKDATERAITWENNNEKQIKTITAKLASIEGVDFDREQELHLAKSELNSIKKELESEQALKRQTLTTIEKKIKKNNEELSHLRDDKCPYCLQGMPNANDKIQSLKLDNNTQYQNKQVIEKQLAKLQAEIQTIGAEFVEISEEIKYPDLQQLLNIRAQRATFEAQLDEYAHAVNPHTETIETLTKENVADIDYELIDRLKAQQEHQQFLLKLLVDKNSFIRRRIINRTIPFLNERINYYAKELGLPHVVKFDDNMSCTVSEFGRELDFGNLSGGEKKRVNLAIAIAFRDVLHRRHAFINVLFLDEIDASLDATGTDVLIKLIRNKANSDNLGIWVIMHRPEAEGKFDKTMLVIKEGGFSRLEELQLNT